MYISKIEIKNIRSIESLSINVEKLGDSIILTGKNGAGKSTVLKCIAMGIVDEDSAASVLREMSGELVRKGKSEGLIKIEFRDIDNKRFIIKTRIVSQEMFEKVFQEVFVNKNGKFEKAAQEDFPWYSIFASGYGAGIRTIGSTDYKYYVAIDALYSLFKQSAELQNPELSLRRIMAFSEEKKKNSGIKVKDEILKKIEKILLLKSMEEIILTSSSIEIKLEKYGRHELSTLGDGYISTITMLLDLYSWWMLFLKSMNKSMNKNLEIKGIMLVDEVEKHLNPKWKQLFMKLTKNTFPDIQLIFSSNSSIINEEFEGLKITL